MLTINPKGGRNRPPSSGSSFWRLRPTPKPDAMSTSLDPPGLHG